MSSIRQLFGGALQTSLPEHVIDASDLRQVPDTQEVFLFPDSDSSIIFEILEIVREEQAANDLREAVRYHFSSLAHDNSALSSEVDSVSSPFPLPSSSHSPYKPPPAVAKQGEDDDSITHLYATLEGTQVVSKFNLSEEEADLVKIFLAVIRVDLHEPSPANPQITRGADITVTINVPLGRATQIKAAQGILDANVKELEVKAKQWFQQAVQDFKIVDYGLFA